VALTHVLLFFHLLGAVSFFAGAAVVGTLQLSAIRRERPSEIFALLRLAPVGAAFVGLGALLTLGFGIALAEHEGFGLSAPWIQAALGLWVAAMVLGGYGGRTARHARHLAEELAANGDARYRELHELLAAPLPLAASYASGLMLLAILALMVWQPGNSAPTYSSVVPVSDQQQIVSEHPRIAYVPTRIPAGYSYVERVGDWSTGFDLVFARFKRQGEPPDNLRFGVFDGSCPSGRLHSLRVDGVAVSWAARNGFHLAWRCLAASGRTGVVLQASREIAGDGNLDTPRRRHEALRLAAVVADAKRIG
jgi:uncharacterized membrane protein